MRARYIPGTWTCGPSLYLTGADPGACCLADVALTRVAAPRSLIVNSPRGGGAKDTWIVTRRRDGGPTHVRTGR